MAEAVKRKKKVRGGHKSYVTSTINSVNELLESYEPAMANQVKRYRVALNERLEILTTLDNEIVELVDEKEIEQEITDSAVFRESIHKVLLDMEEKLSFNVDTPSDKSLNNSSINLGHKVMIQKLRPNYQKLIYDHFQETLSISSPSLTHLKAW